MQFTFTTVNWFLHLVAELCVVLYSSSVAVNTTVTGSSVDAAGGRGSVEKINSRWRRLPRV